jgi:hypothetical protein
MSSSSSAQPFVAVSTLYSPDDSQVDIGNSFEFYDATIGVIEIQDHILEYYNLDDSNDITWLVVVRVIGAHAYKNKSYNGIMPWVEPTA